MKRIKQWKIYLVTVLTVVLACCFLAACGGSWKIALNKNELTLEAGKSETLIAECAAEGVAFSWSSDNVAVATVSGEGEVVAVAAGTCTVTVTAAKGGEEKTATCSVTVSPAPTAAFKVETYVQKDDLSFEKEGETEKNAAIGATVSESPAAREGFIVDKENSVLSAIVAADGTTTLKIYYALPYKNLYLVREDGYASFYRVYEEKEMIVNEQGAEANISEEFAPTENAEGKYYFWNVGGVTSRGSFTKEELLAMKDESLIREDVSSDAVFNTVKPNANFIAKDGGFQTEATTKWGESASYLYYTGSSDTLYAKVQVDNLRDSGDMDISAGFTLADARNHSKNVQFYFSGSSKGGWLAQNNSYHWEDNDSVRWVVENAAEVPTDAQSNVFEIIVLNGNVAVYSNAKLMYVLPVVELTGAGNEPGVLAETTVFDLGIAQWRFNHTAKFTSQAFAYGDAAKTQIEARLPKLSLNKDTLTPVFGDDPITLTANWDSLLVKLDASEIVWDSSNKAVATVENGTVTLLAAGETEITANYQFLGVTLSAKCAITVEEPADVTLTLSQTKITAANEKADHVTLTASWDADETLDTSAIEWESEDHTVATVENGEITFTGIGSTTVTARCAYKGRTVRATCSVTVTGTYLFNGESAKATYNDDGTIDFSTGGGWQPNYAYAKGQGTAFYISTEITAIGAEDKDISAGFTVKGKNGDSFQLYLCYGGNKWISMNFLHRWEDGNKAVEETIKWLFELNQKIEVTPEKAAKMGLAYQDGVFYLFIQNELVYAFPESALTYRINSEDKIVESAEGGWAVGIASWNNHKPRFTNSYVTFDSEAVQAQIEANAPKLSLNKTSFTAIKSDAPSNLTASWDSVYFNLVESEIVWNSSNEAVATVENGTVTLLAAGEAEITATYQFFGVTLTAKCAITVEEPANVTLTLNTADTTDVKQITAANEKADHVTLTASWDADETLDTSAIEWSSEDPTVATVEDGVVTFTGIGSTTVTARYSYKGKPVLARCTVTVTGTYLFNGDSSKATYNDDGTIDFKTGDEHGGRYAYAKGQGNAFYVSTDITSLNGEDKDVSAGFTLKGKNGDSVQLYLSYGGNQWLVMCFNYGWDNVKWLPDSDNGFNKGIEVTNDKAAKMGLAYREGVFYVFLQDKLAYTFPESMLTNGSSVKVEPSEDGWTVGVACFEAKNKNRELRFSNSYVTFDGEAVQTKIAEYSPKLALNQATVSVAEGAAEQTLTAMLKLTDGAADNDIYSKKIMTVQWESSNEAVVTVANGVLTFVGAGTATVTAKYTLPGYGEISATCAVSVTATADLPTLSLDQSSLTKTEGDEEETLTASWNKVGETLVESDIVWKSSNEAVATVENGKVTFLAEGTAEITASYQYLGVTLSAKCTVTVEKFTAATLILNTTDTTDVKVITAANEKADHVTLIASWDAEDETLGTIEWESGDPSVATVENGEVTFTGIGSTTVTAKCSYKGRTIRATCTVTVTGTYLFNGEHSSKATYNDDGTIDFKTGTDNDAWHYAYAKGQGNTFYVSTEITTLSGELKDLSAGFTVIGKDGKSFHLHLGSTNNKWLGISFNYIWGNYNQGTLKWLPDYNNGLNKGIEVTNEKAARMGLAYREGVFYVFLQGQLAYSFSENDLTNGSQDKVEPAEDGWTVGIASFEKKGTTRNLHFANNYVTFDGEAVQTKIAEYSPKLALDQTTVSVAQGAAEQTLTATLKLTDGTTDNDIYQKKIISVVWGSSDDAVVTVSNGVLTFVGAGTATVTAKYTLPGYGEITATCAVTVTAEVL